MDVREKLVELVKRAIIDWEHGDASEWIADHLIANGVMVQENTVADVAPVRHGRWIDAREYCGDYMCSNCEALYGTNKFHYCPNCGSKMDGERKEGANNEP